jgi:hypothetical protein
MIRIIGGHTALCARRGRGRRPYNKYVTETAMSYNKYVTGNGNGNGDMKYVREGGGDCGETILVSRGG